MTNALLASLFESKVECECNGKDFISDLVPLYGNVCKKIATHFGSVAISHVGDDLDTASLPEHNIKVSSEKRLFKMRYETIKQKANNFRQD